jgi:hypothetical protein
MSRTADYTIQGFIYQFIITFHKILLSKNDAVITVEGIIEDIDITTPTGKEAIQCKYHESKAKFVLSSIYKPVLQMICHFQKNPAANIKYRLHAHFPNETVGSKRSLTKAEIETILGSKAADLKDFIKELKGFTAKASFIKAFEIEFGASLADTQKAVIVCLSNEGFSTEDATEIFYPNAIHEIAELSIQHEENKRKIKKSIFLNILKTKKKTAISRWTKELESFEKLLKKRRKQLADILNQNTRARALILDSEYITDFESNVPLFIQEYIQKYNSKVKLNQSPIFSIKCDEGMLNRTWKILNDKKIDIERGMVAGSFDVSRFLKEPMKSVKDGTVEFKLRLCNHDAEFDQVFNRTRLEDLIIISDKDFPNYSKTGINIEKLKTSEINELKYLLSLTTTL